MRHPPQGSTARRRRTAPGCPRPLPSGRARTTPGPRRAQRELESGVAPASTRLPMTLSSALWRPTSSRTRVSSPVGVNRPVACRPPVRSNVRLRRAQALGQRADDVRRHERAVAQRLGGHLDRVDRGLPAHAAGRRHGEVALHETGLERPAEMDGHDVIGLLAQLDVGAVLDLGYLELRCQEALGVQEPGSELEIMSRGAHRDGDAHRLLARPSGTDLERLLPGEAVAPLTPHAILHRQHASVDRRTAQGRPLGGCHRELLLRAAVAVPARAGSRSAP